MAGLADLSISNEIDAKSLAAANGVGSGNGGATAAGGGGSASSVPVNVLFPAVAASSIVDKHAQLSVLDAFRGKNVLITGATGFVGKVIVEKLLRCVPEVGGLYLLVRPRKGQTAEERMFKEIVCSEIFTRLRKERKDFEEFVASKLVALPGELTSQNIGMSTKSIAFIESNIHIILHCAAIVDFNERLDKAIEMNVFGALRLLELAQRCTQLEAMVHTSTAYVNSNRRGAIDEKLYPLGFEPDAVLRKVRAMNVTELEKVTVTGLLGDWPNTYTFTKAMAEVLLIQKRGTVPLVILRPSIVGCSWKEPVPGWTDVITAAGAVYMTVGMGVLKFLPGSPNTTADITPVDYVINAMLTCIPAIRNQNRFFVVQPCTSVEMPMYWGYPKQVLLKFFASHPPTRGISTPRMEFMRSPQEYQVKFFLHYSVPSALFNSLALVTGSPNLKTKAAQFNKLVWRARVITESFKHFVENEWLFNNRNVQTMREHLKPEEQELFWMDFKGLNWLSYNESFGFGLMRYVLKEDMIEMDPHDFDNSLSLSTPMWSKDKDALDGFIKNYCSDLHFVYTQLNERPQYPVGRPLADMRTLILGSPKVQAAIRAETATNPKLTPAQVETRARSIIDKMFGDSSLKVMGGLSWFFRKVWRRIYENISVDKAGVERIRALAAKGPLVFMPSHRSYIDFLVVSYLCFCCHLPLPYIAAGEDFLGILLVRWLFRKSGAFFIKRSFLGSDPLYTAIFSSYIESLLLDGLSVEFFVEGTRSRSGKMLHPKMGLLSVITGVFLDRKVPDVTIVPVNINYEKTMEGDLYSNELLGENKIKESLRSLLRSSSVLNVNFGQIVLAFGTPFSLKEYTAKHIQDVKTNGVFAPQPTPTIYTPPPIASAAGSDSNTATAAAATTVDTPFSAASFSSPFTETKTESKSARAAKAARSAGTALLPAATAAGGDPSDYSTYDPFSSSERDRKVFNRTLAYRVVYSLSEASEAFPSHLLATLMLMYRQGITRTQLTAKMEWLRKEITTRGGVVAGMQGEFRKAIVDNSVKHLSHLIVQRRQNVLEPAITARKDYKNMLVLGHYRNKIVHLFFREGLWAVALYSFGELMLESGVERSKLLTEVAFLHSLLQKEFIYKEDPDQPEDFEATLAVMIKRGILKASGPAHDPRIEVASTGEAHFSFLCALLWPFIDSYFTASLILFSLQPDRTMEENLLLQRTQWLATTLYHESMLCFYESCSMETLRNAFVVLQSWRVIKIEKPAPAPGASPTASDKPKPFVVSLMPPFHEESALQQLTQRISRLRKQPPVRRGGVRRNLIADIPILAKL